MHMQSTILTLILLPLFSLSNLLPTAFNECRVGQINTYTTSQPLISQITTSHKTFLQNWWTYRCKIEPWIGCRVPCQEPQRHFEDPFTFCFSDRKVRAPGDSGVVKAVHQSVKDFLLCDTYFVNGTRRQSVYADDRVYGMGSGVGGVNGR